MAAAVGLRADYDAAQLRELAKRSEDADQTRRLLALAVVYDGGSRSEGAQAGGVGAANLPRLGALRSNTAGPPGLLNAKALRARRRCLTRHSAASWRSLSRMA